MRASHWPNKGREDGTDERETLYGVSGVGLSARGWMYSDDLLVHAC